PRTAPHLPRQPHEQLRPELLPAPPQIAAEPPLQHPDPLGIEPVPVPQDPLKLRAPLSEGLPRESPQRRPLLPRQPLPLTPPAPPPAPAAAAETARSAPRPTPRRAPVGRRPAPRSGPSPRWRHSAHPPPARRSSCPPGAPPFDRRPRAVP